MAGIKSSYYFLCILLLVLALFQHPVSSLFSFFLVTPPLSNSILEYGFFTKYSVFLSHFRSSLRITPQSLAWFTTSSFPSFKFKFVVNLYLSVKLKIITLVFFWFRIIFWFFVPSFIFSRYSFVLRCSAGMNWLCTGISDLTSVLKEWLANPTGIRFTFSRIVKGCCYICQRDSYPRRTLSKIH